MSLEENITYGLKFPEENGITLSLQEFHSTEVRVSLLYTTIMIMTINNDKLNQCLFTI